MATKEDYKWLQDFVDRQGTNAVEVRNARGEKESVTDFLEQVTADVPDSDQPSTKKQEKLQKQAERKGAADQARLQREQAQAEESAQARRRERAEQGQQFAVRLANRTISGASDAIAPTVDKVGAMPTVGGIGLLLLLLAILLLVVVRVNPNGDTRAKQIWYMLTGRASLQGSVKPSGVASPEQGVNVIPGGASGDFGSNTTTSSNTSQQPTSSNSVNNFLGTLDLGF